MMLARINKTKLITGIHFNRIKNILFVGQMGEHFEVRWKIVQMNFKTKKYLVRFSRNVNENVFISEVETLECDPPNLKGLIEGYIYEKYHAAR